MEIDGIVGRRAPASSACPGIVGVPRHRRRAPASSVCPGIEHDFCDVKNRKIVPPADGPSGQCRGVSRVVSRGVSRG